MLVLDQAYNIMGMEHRRVGETRAGQMNQGGPAATKAPVLYLLCVHDTWLYLSQVWSVCPRDSKLLEGRTSPLISVRSSMQLM